MVLPGLSYSGAKSTCFKLSQHRPLRYHMLYPETVKRMVAGTCGRKLVNARPLGILLRHMYAISSYPHLPVSNIWFWLAQSKVFTEGRASSLCPSTSFDIFTAFSPSTSPHPASSPQPAAISPSFVVSSHHSRDVLHFPLPAILRNFCVEHRPINVTPKRQRRLGSSYSGDPLRGAIFRPRTPRCAPREHHEWVYQRQRALDDRRTVCGVFSSATGRSRYSIDYVGRTVRLGHDFRACLRGWESERA